MSMVGTKCNDRSLHDFILVFKNLINDLFN